jgi:hypothetical protein
MHQPSVRSPHNGGVRSLFLVEEPPFWTIPSRFPRHEAENHKRMNQLATEGRRNRKLAAIDHSTGGAVAIDRT